MLRGIGGNHYREISTPFCLLGLLSPVSQAQMGDRICGTRDSIVQTLKERWNEKPHGIGIRAAGGVVELWCTDEGESFSIVVTLPNGQTCIVGHGVFWQILGSQGKKS